MNIFFKRLSVLVCLTFIFSSSFGLNLIQAQQSETKSPQSISVNKIGAVNFSKNLYSDKLQSSSEVSSGSSYIAISKGLSMPIQLNYDPQNVFYLAPPGRADLFLFGEQLTPQLYPATLTSVFYPSFNSSVKDSSGNFFPSAEGAHIRVTIFAAATDADISKIEVNDAKSRDFIITKDFSNPILIKSYDDFNEFDTPDVTITKGSFFVLLQFIGAGTSELSSNGSDFLYFLDTASPSKAIASTDGGKTLFGVGVSVENNVVDFLVAGRITLENSKVPPPQINNVSFENKHLSIVGTGLSSDGIVTVNGQTIFPKFPGEYSEDLKRLKISGKAAKLNLKNGSNEIVFRDGKLKSARFRFKR